MSGNHETEGAEDAAIDLNAAMDARRTKLHVTWTELARRAGMSPQNLLRIRNREINVSWEAADGIDDALLWKRGQGIQALLDGKQPVEIATDATTKVDKAENLSGDDTPQSDRPAIASQEWLAHYANTLDVDDYADLMEVLRRTFRAETKIAELEQRLSELEKALTERVRA